MKSLRDSITLKNTNPCKFNFFYHRLPDFIEKIPKSLFGPPGNIILPKETGHFLPGSHYRDEFYLFENQVPFNFFTASVILGTISKASPTIP
jgi:hypothetical protein